MSKTQQMRYYMQYHSQQLHPLHVAHSIHCKTSVDKEVKWADRGGRGEENGCVQLQVLVGICGNYNLIYKFFLDCYLNMK